MTAYWTKHCFYIKQSVLVQILRCSRSCIETATILNKINVSIELHHYINICPSLYITTHFNMWITAYNKYENKHGMTFLNAFVYLYDSTKWSTFSWSIKNRSPWWLGRTCFEADFFLASPKQASIVRYTEPHSFGHAGQIFPGLVPGQIIVRLLNWCLKNLK